MTKEEKQLESLKVEKNWAEIGLSIQIKYNYAEEHIKEHKEKMLAREHKIQKLQNSIRLEKLQKLNND